MLYLDVDSLKIDSMKAVLYNSVGGVVYNVVREVVGEKIPTHPLSLMCPRECTQRLRKSIHRVFSDTNNVRKLRLIPPTNP